MKLINGLRNILSGLYRSIKRFPVTILFSAAVAIMLVVRSEMKLPYDSSLQNMLDRITMIFALGVPLTLCMKAHFERKDDNKIYKLIIYYGSGALILVLYYFLLLKDRGMVSTTRYAAVSLALYIGFLYIPYLPKREELEMYIIKILTGFFTTVIYSVVLYLGLAAILFTIDKLLGIHVADKVYFYTWLFVAFIFAPTYFLAGIPLRNDKLIPDNYPKLLRILLLYIVMPLAAAYTTILYIYFIKIIVTRQWPVGLVSHLVLWYSVIVVIVLFLITPIKHINNWADKFSRWAPRIIIPILIMMFVSMGIRINAYGITENRYYVIALGLWVAFIMVYLSFVKRPVNIIIPVALSIIALISVFGPLSSYTTSKYSQNNRFERILVANNMLINGRIQPVQSNISTEDKDEISRILDYFKNSHSFKDIRYIPEGFKTEDMEKVFGFPYETPKYYTPGGYFYLVKNQSEKAIDIKDYDYLIDSRNMYDRNAAANKEIDGLFDYESGIIRVSHNGQTVIEKDIRPFAKALSDKYNAVSKENAISAEDMILTEENDKVKVKIVFMHISGNSESANGSVNINGADFYVLVKMK